ncbi:hypothetical protein BDP55DRAFT_422479 [Colletotrichum godetiae]|uniref:Uncharacterized protein n=1 Tax=Colletotrichum godetiae TaxID=1209918 RepID=A0AAJ0A9Q4_9PEZI|nr:uncharacterized protein BDP55DRAFT_422479 [Colletotrichum godetiae]KAK1657656.1 hypothetical protein BDP55DRAFT_422479 [Colletotrichum godetiae]
MGCVKRSNGGLGTWPQRRRGRRGRRGLMSTAVGISQGKTRTHAPCGGEFVIMVATAVVAATGYHGEHGELRLDEANLMFAAAVQKGRPLAPGPSLDYLVFDSFSLACFHFFPRLNGAKQHLVMRTCCLSFPCLHDRRGLPHPSARGAPARQPHVPPTSRDRRNRRSRVHRATRVDLPSFSLVSNRHCRWCLAKNVQSRVSPQCSSSRLCRMRMPTHVAAWPVFNPCYRPHRLRPAELRPPL